MKIYLTTYKDDGVEYAEPNIHANSLENAEEIAEMHGLKVSGQLTDIYQPEEIIQDILLSYEFHYDTDTQYRTIH